MKYPFISNFREIRKGVMKYPFKIAQVEGDAKGWYIEDADGYTLMGNGARGKDIADRTYGEWVRAYDQGYKAGINVTWFQRLKLTLDIARNLW